MKKYILIAGLFLAALLPLACQQTYEVPPLSISTPSGPTTVCTGPCTVGQCAAGIYWLGGHVWNYDLNSAFQYAAELTLAVNCTPETTAGVTLTGPSVNLPLTYSGMVTNYWGTVCADYRSVTVSGGLSAGANYTLTSVTSIGTATSTLRLPISPNANSNGLTITWNGWEDGCLYLLQDWSGGVSMVDVGCGFYAISPLYFLGPCSSPCMNGAEFSNGTAVITGGTGNFQISNGQLRPGP